MLKSSHELKFLNTENGLHWNVNVLYLEEFLIFNYVDSASTVFKKRNLVIKEAKSSDICNEKIY